MPEGLPAIGRPFRPVNEGFRLIETTPDMPGVIFAQRRLVGFRTYASDMAFAVNLPR